METLLLEKFAWSFGSIEFFANNWMRPQACSRAVHGSCLFSSR